MSMAVADLAHHILTLRRLHARVLEAEFELLRRAYGESLMKEAMRLADETAQKASPAPQELLPESDERANEIAKASEIAKAFDRVMKS
jgi:hypothetical protein